MNNVYMGLPWISYSVLPVDNFFYQVNIAYSYICIYKTY
jgi:hypothetical protein